MALHFVLFVVVVTWQLIIQFNSVAKILFFSPPPPLLLQLVQFFLHDHLLLSPCLISCRIERGEREKRVREAISQQTPLWPGKQYRLQK